MTPGEIRELSLGHRLCANGVSTCFSSVCCGEHARGELAMSVADWDPAACEGRPGLPQVEKVSEQIEADQPVEKPAVELKRDHGEP